MTDTYQSLESFQEHLADLIRPYRSKYGYNKTLHRRLRIMSPYTFTTLANGSILPLNRLYKPLGVAETTWVEYEDFADQAWPASEIDLAAAPIKSRNGGPGHCEAYLYSDSTSPWLSGPDKKRYLRVLSDVLSPASPQHLEP